jgi:hypothetical protein
LLEDSDLDSAELGPEWSGDFAVAGFVFALLAGCGAEQVGLLGTFVFQFGEVLLDSSVFGVSYAMSRTS